MSASLDTERIGALWGLATEIIGERIPTFRQEHGVGAAVERRVIEMMLAALECADLAAALAAMHPPTKAAFARRAQIIRDRIADAEAELKAWNEAEQMVAVQQAMHEARNSTLH